MSQWIRRSLALGVSLVFSAGLLVGSHQAPANAAAPPCDTAAVVRWALDQLGEYKVDTRIISPADMVAETGAANNYGYAEPELLVFSSAAQCRYLAATVAHEVAHVWQYRASGARDLYSALGHDYVEIIADCIASSTGWEDYQPYLTTRLKEIGQAGCTTAETAAATALHQWAR